MSGVAINLQIVFDSSHVVEAARSLRERLPTPQWNLVRALAAEVVALGESETGQEVLVLPATLQALEEAKRLVGRWPGRRRKGLRR